VLKRPLSICLINRNYPPNKGATGYYASHLVDAIRSRAGYDVHVITTGEQKSTADITYVLPVYSGRQKMLRLLGAYRESRLLIDTAVKRTPDVFIVMTDPALLNYWASKRLNDKTWVYWSMDLFPEGFKANKLISERSWMYKRYQSVLKNGRPSHILGLGRGQINYLKKQYLSEASESFLPIGLRNEGEFTKETTFVKGERTVGYVGNVGEAHDPSLIADCLLAFAQRNFEVVLRCYGAGSQKLLGLVVDSAVIIKDRVSDQELKNIDIHIVSLRQEWTHICVPSKAISAVQCGNTVVYLGSQESDTWQMTKDAGWMIESASEVNDVIDTITAESIDEKKKAARQVAIQLKANYKEGLSSFFTFLEKIKSKQT